MEGGVNPNFAKTKNKDSKYGNDVLFDDLNFIIEVQKVKLSAFPIQNKLNKTLADHWIKIGPLINSSTLPNWRKSGDILHFFMLPFSEVIC